MMGIMEVSVRTDHGKEAWTLEGSIRFLKSNLEGLVSPESMGRGS